MDADDPMPRDPTYACTSPSIAPAAPSTEPRIDGDGDGDGVSQYVPSTSTDSWPWKRELAYPRPAPATKNTTAMVIVRGVRVFLAAEIAYAIPVEMLTRDITINTRDGFITPKCDDENIHFKKSL